MMYDPSVTQRHKLEPWRQTLLNAADYLEKHGWCQDATRETSTGKVCAMGAIIHTPFLHSKAKIGATNHLEEYVLRYRDVYGVVNWNDAPGQTKEHVVNTLRECALTMKPLHSDPNYPNCE